MIKPPLILGTAEFGHLNYAPHPHKREIVRILNLAWEAGIEYLDTADTYNTEYLEPYFRGFRRLFKSRIDPDAFYHYQPLEPPNQWAKRASVYDLEQLKGLTHAIAPINIENTQFIGKDSYIYARSIFANGQLLKEGYTVKDCLDFVKRQPVIGIIVGVRSVRELKEILKVY